MATPTLLRVLSNVAIGDGCWEWTAYRTPAGYGMTRAGKGSRQAHRVVYELLVGPIPAGLQIDHLCRNRACVRPDHLEPVTLQENLRRGDSWVVAASLRRAQTHCKRGHVFAEHARVDVRGVRHCRVCAREHNRTYRLRKVG